MNLVLLGPPGAGKGTQAKRLAARLKAAHISTGALFREEYHEKSKLGLAAHQYWGHGELVPDDLTVQMVRERIRRAGADGGVLLDGFPRTLPQARALDAILADDGAALDGVIDFEVGSDELIRRLSGRRVCSVCGSTYHLTEMPPRQADVCDFCGQRALMQREDDQPEAIVTRLAEYWEKTAPLIDYYREKGKLCPVDAEGGVETTYVRTLAALGLEPAAGPA